MRKEEMHIKNFIMLTVAGLLSALGVTCFLKPVSLYDSGISGTSMLLAQMTPEYLSLSVFLIILNLPLFIFGYKRMGRTFTIYSIYAVLIYSGGAWVVTNVLPIDVSIASPLAEHDLLLCAIFGGLICGIGSGMSIRYGGAVDGIEVLAIIFAKKCGLTVGTFIMVYNVILYVIAGLCLNDWILPLYSIITYAVALKALDFIAEGLDKAKSVMIITNHPQNICEALSNEFGNGITLLRAKGYYSDREKTMIYFVTNRFQINKVREIVKEQDRHAYVTITEVSDVLMHEQA